MTTTALIVYKNKHYEIRYFVFGGGDAFCRLFVE